MPETNKCWWDTGTVGWTSYSLAGCYEQDPYEASTIRPWWSTTICDMIENFLDGSTNYHYLRKFMNSLDFTLFDIVGTYEDSGKINKNGFKSEQERTDIRSVSLGVASYDDEYWRGPMYWSFLRLVMYLDSWVGTKVSDQNGEAFNFEERYFRKSGSFLVNALTRVFGNSLVLEADASSNTQVLPTPLSFAVCQHPEFSTKFGSTYVHPNFCQSWSGTSAPQDNLYARKRRITKPSAWSEVDGTPGDYLVACPDYCGADMSTPLCSMCQPILRVRRPTSAHTWTQKAGESGACSFGVRFDTNHFCGPVSVPTYDDLTAVPQEPDKFNNCGMSATEERTHAFQVDGNVANTNTLWECKECKMYGAEWPVLTRNNGRLGCGIYVKTQETGVNDKFSGPLTASHVSLDESAGKMLNYVKQFFESNQANIAEWIGAALEEESSVLKGKVFYDATDLAFYWRVHAETSIPLSVELQASYREFGETQNANAVGLRPGDDGHVAQGPCDDKNPPDAEEADSCLFQRYNAETAALNSAYLMRDIEDGCMSDASDQEHIEQNTCNPNITRNTVQRLKDFTDQVHRDTFGLRLPLLNGNGGVAETRLATGSRINWIDGALPFYSAQQRHKGNSKDADFIGYLLDNPKRCADTYFNKTLREFACFFDKDNKVQVVVPWLGQDYAFLKNENRDRVRGVDDTLKSDLKQAQIGVDMCHNYEGVVKKIPCAATTCLPSIDEEVYNQSLCFYSTAHNDYYLEELPNKIHLKFLERYHLENNLFNPEAMHSQCYIKYTPFAKQIAKNRQCGHLQAPLGYSPAQIRSRTTNAPSLNRSRVTIAPHRILRDEFLISRRRYSSLWAGDIAQTVFDGTTGVDSSNMVR